VGTDTVRRRAFSGPPAAFRPAFPHPSPAASRGPPAWPYYLGGILGGNVGGREGPDAYRRGKNPEQQAFYFLHELEQIIRHWTAECYHRQPHGGLYLPEVPGLQLSPLEMFAHGTARAGFLQVPARAEFHQRQVSLYGPVTDRGTTGYPWSTSA
jgi:hypothetical protein